MSMPFPVSIIGKMPPSWILLAVVSSLLWHCLAKGHMINKLSSRASTYCTEGCTYTPDIRVCLCHQLFSESPCPSLLSNSQRWIWLQDQLWHTIYLCECHKEATSQVSEIPRNNSVLNNDPMFYWFLFTLFRSSTLYFELPMDEVTMSESIPQCKLAFLHGDGQMFANITPCLDPSETNSVFRQLTGTRLLAGYVLYTLA